MVGIDCLGDWPREPKFPPVSGPVPAQLTLPVTVGLPWTVMLPFEWTEAGIVPDTPWTSDDDSIARSPPVRIALAGLYGAKMYSDLIIRTRASFAPYRGDQPMA